MLVEVSVSIQLEADDPTHAKMLVADKLAASMDWPFDVDHGVEIDGCECGTTSGKHDPECERRAGWIGPEDDRNDPR